MMEVRVTSRTETWYQGSVRDVTLEPDEAAIEDGATLCADCFRMLDPEDQPRWKPMTRATGAVQERTGG